MTDGEMICSGMVGLLIAVVVVTLLVLAGAPLIIVSIVGFASGFSGALLTEEILMRS